MRLFDANLHPKMNWKLGAGTMQSSIKSLIASSTMQMTTLPITSKMQFELLAQVYIPLRKVETTSATR